VEKIFSACNNKLRLIYCPSVTKKEYFNIMTSMDTGDHLSLDSVTYIDCTDIVIEPRDVNGPYMDVDGERKPKESTYLKILPKKLMAIKG